jgi:WD40 repeat protein
MVIQNISFNKVGSRLAISTDTGFGIFYLNPSIEKRFSTDMGGGVGITTLLNNTNLCLMSGGGERRFKPESALILWDDKEKQIINDIDFGKPVRNLAIFRDKFVAVLDTEIYVFDFRGNELFQKSTFCNEKGICAINNNEESPIIVTLGKEKGEIAIWKLEPSAMNCCTIKAHNSEHNIEAVAISKDSKMVATASESGTLINVFSTESYEQLYQFRRGTLTTSIYDLAFSNKNEYLVCCSGNGTVHIFDLYKKTTDSTNTKSSLLPWLPTIVTSYLPQWIDSQWAFNLHHFGITKKMICCFDEKDVLHIATLEGKYYRISGQGYKDVVSVDLDID